ncbi:hypothetical protein JTY60_00010 [symbiont of Argiope bruennichi]|uniref:phosphoenolpyruvate-utilizing N-terminal domain-containing protein n=1 Tax=symbiont of Argiope bruennichi TaxID=2810479 RepID=UPI003DA304CE
MKKISNNIAIGENFGIGKLVFLEDEKIKITRKKITNLEVEKELKFLDNIFSELKKEYQKKLDNYSGFEKDIVFSHLEILKDAVIFDEIKELIKKKLFSLENATNTVFSKYKKIFSEMEDEYFKARGLDIEDLNNIILKKIFNISDGNNFDLNEDVIFVGKEFTPSQILKFPLKHTKGIVNLQGSKTSHASIIASSRDIPILILKENVKISKSYHHIKAIIDAKEKTLIIDPNVSLIKKYQELIENKKIFEKKIQGYLHKESKTIDGFLCNIEFIQKSNWKIKQ